MLDIQSSVAGTSFQIRSKEIIVRISSKLVSLCVVAEVLGLLCLRHVDRDGVFHDVDHLGVGHLAVDLHHGDSITLVVRAGVRSDDSG